MKRLFFLILLLPGCIYYNTFYNAKKYHEEENYNRSIEKCEKVLNKYPKSAYVDDAIFLMGKNYYYLKNFDEAKKNFKRIVDFFPNSLFKDESYLFLGKISLEKRDLDEALIFLERASYSDDPEVIMEVFKTKLALYLLRQNPQKVIDEGQKFIKKYSANSAEAYYLIGNANRLTGKNEIALQMYKNSLKESKQNASGKLIYSLAELYAEMDSLSEALSIIDRGEGSDSLSLLKGKILMKLENFDEAIKSLESVSKKSDSLGVAAKFHLGEIKEIQGDTTTALELYKKAESAGDFGELSKKARAKKETLENILLLKTLPEKTKDGEEKNSEPVPNHEKKDSAYIFFRLGEIYYWDLKEKEKGAEWYRKVPEQFPQSRYAPKAIFTLLNIELKEDSTSHAEVRELFSILAEKYPNTKYAEKAKELYEPGLQDTNCPKE